MQFSWLFIGTLLISLHSISLADEPSLDSFINKWTSMLHRFHSMRDDIILDQLNRKTSQSAAIEREGEPLVTADSEPVEGGGSHEGKDLRPEIVIVDKGSEPDSGRGYGNRGGGFGVQSPIWPLRGGNPWFWRGIDSIFTHRRPWWKGANVCVERQVVEENPESDSDNSTEKTISSFLPFTLQSTQCSESETSYTCTTKVHNNHESKTQTVKYQCCHGFKRGEGRSDCQLVELKNITTTLKEIGARKMEGLLLRSDITTQTTDDMTIFSPSDEAMMDYEDDKNKQMNEIPVMGEVDSTMAASTEGLDANDVASHHIVRGLYRTGDFKNNMILPTINNESSVRINIYNFPQRLITANCAPILMPNNYASNAIIHVIGQTIPRPKVPVFELLENDGRFATFLNLLKKSEFIAELNDTKKAWTVLAPTDDAFKKLNPRIMQRIESGPSCYDSIIPNHLISNVICSSAISDMIWERSKAHNQLTFTRSESKLFVEELPIDGNEKLGVNGIVYVLNDVLIPDDAKPLSANLDSRITSQFLKLVNESGLLNEWDSLENITAIVPTNEAFKKLSEAEVSMLANNTEILNYHIAKSLISSSNFYNNKLMDTLADQKIRLNLIEKIPGLVTRASVQCAKIVHMNRNVCSGVVLLVDSILKPPRANIIEALDSMDGFDIFRSLVKNSSFAEKLREESGPFTVLAVSDDSLKSQLSAKDLEDLKSDSAKAERLLQKHILPEMVCCSSVSQASLILNFQRFKLMDSSTLNAHRDLHGGIKFWSPSMHGMASVTKCDNMAANGVVHVINRPIQLSNSSGDSTLRGPNIPMIIQGFLSV